MGISLSRICKGGLDNLINSIVFDLINFGGYKMVYNPQLTKEEEDDSLFYTIAPTDRFDEYQDYYISFSNEIIEPQELSDNTLFKEELDTTTYGSIVVAPSNLWEDDHWKVKSYTIPEWIKSHRDKEWEHLVEVNQWPKDKVGTKNLAMEIPMSSGSINVIEGSINGFALSKDGTYRYHLVITDDRGLGLHIETLGIGWSNVFWLTVQRPVNIEDGIITGLTPETSGSIYPVVVDYDSPTKETWQICYYPPLPYEYDENNEKIYKWGIYRSVETYNRDINTFTARTMSQLSPKYEFYTGEKKHNTLNNWEFDSNRAINYNKQIFRKDTFDNESDRTFWIKFPQRINTPRHLLGYSRTNLFGFGPPEIIPKGTEIDVLFPEGNKTYISLSSNRLEEEEDVRFLMLWEDDSIINIVPPEFTASPDYDGFWMKYLNDTVQFYANIEGEYSRLEWRFDDGNTSTEENPTHTYSEIGKYFVELEIWDSNDISLTYNLRVIDIVKPLEIDFSVSKEYIFKGDSITLTPNISGRYSSLLWILDDGVNTPIEITEGTPTITLDTIGIYDVSLEVQGFIEPKALTKPDLIHVEKPLEVDFTYLPTNIDSNDEIIFSPVIIGSYETLEWIITSDNGEAKYSDNPLNLILAAGTYTVNLGVKSLIDGDWTFVEKDITVEQALNVGILISPSVIDSDTTITFTPSIIGSYTSVEWKIFNDNNDLVETSTQETYQTILPNGDYVVELIVYSPLGDESITKSFTVSEAIDCSFTMTPKTGQEPLTVVFTNNSTGNIQSYEWDFGDGTKTTTTWEPSHTYTSDGSYTVKLTINSPTGSKSITDKVIVTQEEKSVDFTINPDPGTSFIDENTDITFSAVTQGSYDYLEWFITNGFTYTVSPYPQGEAITLNLPPGTYNVTLRMYDGSDVYTEEKIGVIVVEPYIELQADFKLHDAFLVNYGYAPIDVSWTNTSTGNYTEARWSTLIKDGSGVSKPASSENLNEVTFSYDIYSPYWPNVTLNIKSENGESSMNLSMPEDAKFQILQQPQNINSEIIGTFNDGTGNTQDVYMNVYFPYSPEREFNGGILLIHGGGWTHGDIGEGNVQYEFVNSLRNNGYVVFDLAYRLAEAKIGGYNKFPTQIWDVKYAIRYIRAHFKKYKFNPNKLGVLGTSAGGHLSMLVGITNNRDETSDSQFLSSYCYTNPGDCYDHIDDEPNAVVSLFGISDIEKMESDGSLWNGEMMMKDRTEWTFGTDRNDWWNASPRKYSQGSCPFYLIHSYNDTIISWEQSNNFHNHLLNIGRDSTLDLINGGDHGFGIFDGDLPKEEVINRVVNFYNNKLV